VLVIIGSTQLRQYIIFSKVASICFYLSWQIRIDVGGDRCTREPVFQELKCPVTCLIPVELGIFAKKVSERFVNAVKSFNEPTIEVGTAKKGLNLLDIPWDWPVFHCFGILIRH
jgi:hypothetical protein